MRANDFVRTIKDMAASKKLDWTSFRERRIDEIGRRLESGKIDYNQAIVDVATELKVYNVGRDDIRMLEQKLKK